jgi:hypothetical protein
MQEAAPAATSPPVVTILPQATPPSVETPQTQELGQETKTYTDDVAGFSIDYPTDWSAEGEAGYYAYIAAPSEDIYMNIAASQGVSLSDMLALHLDFLEAITTQISDPLEVTLAGKEGVVVDCEAVDMHGTRIHWREVLVVNGAYGLSFSCRSPADNWQTSQPLFESILGSLTFSEPMAMPEPTPEPELSLVGYDYEYRDVGDGWYEGSVGLALENQTDRLAGFNEIELPPPVIETQEGHTYQGQLGFYGIADFVETGSIGGARMIPPNFRIRARTREEPAAVIFRFAHAAHPTFITFPGYSRFRIDLSVAAQTNSLGFIGSDSGSVRSITELYGNVLVDEPGEAKVTVRTCIIRSSGNLVYPRLVLVIENRNQFEGVNVTVQLPQLAGIRPDGDVHGVEDPTHTYSVGPGQTEEHELELSPGEWDFKSGSFERIATSYVVFYDEIPDKYTIYALSDCTVMR